ncbi:pyrroloquinoline quinone biosynthesis protein PqqB [Breoghania sp. L-A4]|uniref:pyrroloquinoline quinone biosynthesis protein PqqB n=1 Tax=Breoghania sp. L-A4 TaxID=2304600 RepID=UPI000E35FF0A|nr:pyrroloquinoline quinone biosynthesis protein PqqB [Breoghania sp. L-A4]AXS42252.1 pyrroloquinoline quinone biosynthesis protein PqqB [Breoghania sp. L-A4]
MKLRIIGSAAGGGFPQWNCNAPLSRAVREMRPGFLPRTQSSMAASADSESWALFNASPDIRQQIANTPELQPPPDGPLRGSPIKVVVLTNADVDHIAGLLTLRERTPLVIYATARVLKTLADNSIFQVLAADVVERRELPIEGVTEISGPDGPLGLSVETFAVPGKVALFLEDNAAEGFGTAPGDTIGIALRAGDTLLPGADGVLRRDSVRAYYIPGCAAVDDALKARLDGASCLLFDGTVFNDTEMRDAGVGEKTGKRMGHLHIGGPGGSIEALSDVALDRRIFVHINNTNPILEPGSAAERAVTGAGWEIGYDGMELDL